MNRVLLIAMVVMALGGCAATYHEPALPSGHPANSAAESVPMPEPLRTLAIAETDTAPPGAAKPTAAEQGAAHGDHGMAGAPSATPDAGKPAAPAALYVCPMHPEVTSDKPDQRCPKCGMKLVKKEGGRQP